VKVVDHKRRRTEYVGEYGVEKRCVKMPTTAGKIRDVVYDERKAK